MHFMSEAQSNVVGEGAIVSLTPDELRLVDVLVQLHRGAHGGTGTEPIADEDRALLVMASLLSTGRALTGWGPDVLRDLAAAGHPIQTGLASHVREWVGRKPALTLPPFALTLDRDSLLLRCGQAIGTLLSMSAKDIREAADGPLAAFNRRWLLLLADTAEKLLECEAEKPAAETPT